MKNEIYNSDKISSNLFSSFYKRKTYYQHKHKTTLLYRFNPRVSVMEVVGDRDDFKDVNVLSGYWIR